MRERGEGGTEEHSRRITLLTATCVVVANMVGTGVFTSLGFQAAEIPSAFALLLLWAIGGIFALCGALCYGELAAAMPRSGGEYHFLSKIYHPILGFLSGWVSVTVGFAAPIALAAMALGKYLSSAVPGLDPQLVAAGAPTVISLLHAYNLRWGSSFQQVFTLLNVSSILALSAAGLVLAAPQEVSFWPRGEDAATIFSPSFAISLFYVAYAYSGWNGAAYLAGEVKEPEKNLPRSLWLGTLAVSGLYLLLNFVFLYTTPLSQLAGQLDVGTIAARQIFPGVGARLMGLLISMGLIASISSMVLAGSRVSQTIGEDSALFQLLARKNRHGAPQYAIFFQLIVVLTLAATSTFETVLTYLEFTLLLSSFMTVLGVFVCRYRYPHLPRPYQTWGYPVTPLIFLAISLWMLGFSFYARPLESLTGLGTIALGLPVYFWAAKIRHGLS